MIESGAQETRNGVPRAWDVPRARSSVPTSDDRRPRLSVSRADRPTPPALGNGLEQERQDRENDDDDTDEVEQGMQGKAPKVQAARPRGVWEKT